MVSEAGLCERNISKVRTFPSKQMSYREEGGLEFEESR